MTSAGGGWMRRPVGLRWAAAALIALIALPGSPLRAARAEPAGEEPPAIGVEELAPGLRGWGL